MTADYLRLGDWNILCDRCGRKLKGSQAKQTWEGFWVCPEHWEPRQPQDFVRSVPENPSPPFVRNPADIFIATPEALILEGPDWADTPWLEIDYILAESGSFIISES